MKLSRLLASASVLATVASSLGCAPESDPDLLDDSDTLETSEDTGEAAAPIVNGTTTTDYAPVVRISWSKKYSCGFLNLETCTETHYCTATAIADDMLVTASHCVKDGTGVTGYITVATAHGANSSTAGKTSSYFIMSDDVYHNVDENNTGDYKYRDFAFIKFGAGTFSEYYGTTTTPQSGQPAWSVTKVGFGGDSTKEYTTKTIVKYGDYDGGDYRILYTDRNGAYNESGDSGGPILKWNSTISDWEVLGVVFGYSGSYDTHPSFTPAMETLILAPMRTNVPKYCAEAHEHPSYGGFHWSLCNRGAINNKLDDFSDPFIAESRSSYGAWNDKMSSLELPSYNTTVTVYEHNNFGGKAVTFQNLFNFGNAASVPSLIDEGINDMVSSWAIWSGTSGTATDWHLEITLHGKCIDVSNNHVAGKDVFQWDCESGNDNQIFKIVPSGNNYNIQDKASGLCLGAEGGGTSNGTKIELQTCDGTNKQLFTLSSNTSTSSVRDFKMVNVNSGKCVDLEHGYSTNGTLLSLYTCSSTNVNQNFALKRI